MPESSGRRDVRCACRPASGQHAAAVCVLMVAAVGSGGRWTWRSRCVVGRGGRCRPSAGCARPVGASDEASAAVCPRGSRPEPGLHGAVKE